MGSTDVEPENLANWGKRSEPLCCDLNADVVCLSWMSARARDFCTCFIAAIAQLLLSKSEFRNEC